MSFWRLHAQLQKGSLHVEGSRFIHWHLCLGLGNTYATSVWRSAASRQAMWKWTNRPTAKFSSLYSYENGFFYSICSVWRKQQSCMPPITGASQPNIIMPCHQPISKVLFLSMTPSSCLFAFTVLFALSSSLMRRHIKFSSPPLATPFYSSDCNWSFTTI